MFKTEDIAIVILNWNGKSLLEQFLPSVIAYSDNANIYVADNASTDDSVSFIESGFPNIKIIQNKTNGGYAKGYNGALRYVKEPIFCLLNSDVDVTKNWLEAILQTYNSQPETAIIQPKILDYKKKSHFEYAGAAGGFIDKYGYPYCRGRLFNTIEEDKGQYDDTCSVFWASGACFFIKKSVFAALNGFDEHFFAHMEEIDLCWRAFNKKYKCMYVGTSTVYHVGGATLKQSSPQKTYLNFRNSLFTLVKNTNVGVFRRIFMRLLLDGIASIRFLFLLKPLHVFSILRAHFSFYAALPRLMRQRKGSKQLANYFHRKSIVWDYFVRKKQSFDCL